MTNNKFWLVWTPQGITPPKKRYETQEEAIAGAKKLAESYPKQDVFVVKATHHFKANVNVIETDLSAPENDFVELADPTPEESLAVEPKFKVGDFKVGDKVKIKDGIVQFMKNIVDIWEIEELLPLPNRVKLKSQYYQVTVFLNEITLAE